MAGTAGIVSAVAGHGPPVVTPAGDPPATITIDGIRLSLDGATRVLRVRSTVRHPRTLVLEAGRAGARPTPCSAFVTRVRVVSESATAVRVAAYLYRADLPAEPGTICPTFMPGPATLPVRLAAPFGTRHVTDHPTGRDVPIVTDRDLATPGFLPGGYRTTPDVNYSPTGLPLVETQTFPGPAGARLVVEQAVGGPPPPTRWSDVVVGHARVRGRDAVLSRGQEPAGHACLSFVADRGGVLVCSYADPPLGGRALVDVAASLRP